MTRRSTVFPHFFAGMLALAFAWQVSKTPYFQTGLQFVSPLAVILMVHIAHMMLTRDLRPGWSGVVLARGAGTSVIMVLALILGDALLPMPSQANTAESFFASATVFVVCALMIIIVALIVVAAFYVLWRIINSLFKLANRDNKLNDGATITVVFSVIALASVEGMGDHVSFDGHGRVTAHEDLPLSEAELWQILETATSGAFPRPMILQSFPQPVEVMVDEGMALGGNRKVRFEGREGSGILHLQVTHRDAHSSKLTVLSDSTPLAHWIAISAISYRVVATPTGSRLSVTLDYERKLAPHWVMGPVMKAAGYLAMRVLAEDVAARSKFTH